MIAYDLKLLFILLGTMLAETFSEARQIRSTRSCPQGCMTCSQYNGCFSCRPQYYFLLYRSGMKQIGVCTHACPTGYYRNRANDYFQCSRCHVQNCATCFDKHFCAFCEPPYYSHQGRCVLTCPTNMYADTTTGECKALPVDCTVGTWTQWGDCSKNGRTCGYKYGLQLRIREISQHPTPGGQPCPDLTEERKCRMAVRHCPGQEQKPNRRSHKKPGKTRDKQRIEQPISSARTSAARRRRKKKRKLSPTTNEVESHL